MGFSDFGARLCGLTLMSLVARYYLNTGGR
jgi:hypothetical protein